MKYNKIFTALLSLLIFGAVSCSDDWNDHYNSATLGEGTLWEVISSNPDLSNFAQVLQTTGYDKALASSQVYTVFAPTNDNFTDEERDAVIAEYNQQLAQGYKDNKNTAIKEFVQNHIALYNYSVTPETPDTTIRVMNGKYISFTNAAFSGKSYTSTNVITGNGVLFTISDQADYMPSIFEYLKEDAELDSVKNFLYMSNPYQYNVEEFQPSQSVAGEIINGKQHYLDSVTVTKNSLLNSWLKANLDDEDSTYYALMPTNKAWKAQYEKNATYFHYNNTVSARDSLSYIYPRYFILAGAQFSTTQNRLLGQFESIDSIVSPLAPSYSERKSKYGSYDVKMFQYDQPYAQPNGIFTNTTSVTCSNGVVLKTDEWKPSRKSTFLYDQVFETEARNVLDSLSGVKQAAKPSWTAANVATDNKFYNQVSGHTYYTLLTSKSAMPGVLFDIHNILSNIKYDVYVYTVPAVAGDILSTDTLPTRFIAKLYCYNEDGKLRNYMNMNDSIDFETFIISDNSQKSISSDYGGDLTYSSSKRNYSYLVDPTIVQKIKIGTFTFPTCSWGLDEAQVKLYLEISIQNSDVRKNLYSRSLRIDRIVFEPHED